MRPRLRTRRLLRVSELLTRALALSPSEFELLVVPLLEAMCYGRLGAIEHSGKPGDGGIDVIISQDPLGLDRIYLQAKRYDPGVTVSRPDVQTRWRAHGRSRRPWRLSHYEFLPCRRHWRGRTCQRAY